MRDASRANNVITLIVTCLGSFMILLDSSIVVLNLWQGQDHYRL